MQYFQERLKPICNSRMLINLSSQLDAFWGSNTKRIAHRMCTHLLYVGLLGKGDPGYGVRSYRQLLSIHLPFLHLHQT